MAQRQTNIAVRGPDFTHLPRGLEVGSQVLVRGRLPEGVKTFSLDLQTDKCGKDVAFHFSSCLCQKTVMRNTKHNNEWQCEERDIPHFPFKSGEKFTIRIWTGPEEFVVLVNGHSFITYKHRLPSKDVRYLRLGEGPEYYEASCHSAFKIPYDGQFVSGLKVGMSVRVRGMMDDDAERLGINFLAGGNTIALHFNPRLPANMCVLNSLTPAGWGREERIHRCPFEEGQFFDLRFLILEGHFKIFVNDEHFVDYEHRVPVEDVTRLEVRGNAALMEVEFNEPMPINWVKEIPSGVEEGDIVVTKGYFFQGGTRFSVNLINGTTFCDDIAFQVNTRRDGGQVVLNTKMQNAWQLAEKHPLPCSMKDMVPFLVEIAVKCGEFHVFINGKKLASYKARGEIPKIKGIGMKGEAYFHEVKLLKREEETVVEKLPAPMSPGSWISVVGTPNSKTGCGKKFAIDLQCGEVGDCDIAFHFNPRFNGEGTVRNTLTRCGGWGKEERDQPDFPFKVNDRFQVDILRMEDVFRVFVNQKFYLNFAHRISPERVSHCLLCGACDFFEPEFFY